MNVIVEVVVGHTGMTHSIAKVSSCWASSGSSMVVAFGTYYHGNQNYAGQNGMKNWAMV